MDARTESRHIPLCVDLDGTLVSTDTLWESVVALIFQNPLYLFHVFGWALKGKAHLKQRVAEARMASGDQWPYREEVVDWLRSEKEQGRVLILATGAPESVARGVADHLGVFDDVLHTSGDTNLTSHRKLKVLVERFGESGFDYAGNSADDIALFDAAREAIVVAPDRTAKRWQSRNASARLIAPSSRSGLRTILKAIRVHQWLKNSLLAVPVILNHEVVSLASIGEFLFAFFAFSFFASAVYLLNDMVDIPNDRKHATKRERPLASGRLSIPHAAMLAVGLVAASLALTTLLPMEFFLTLCIYAAATTTYSFFLKRKLLVDVFTLAGLYTIRIIAGATATSTDLSFWLLSFSIFFFLSLALVKRYVELSDIAGEGSEKKAGRGYYGIDFDMIGQAGISSAFASALVLALYINSAEVKEMYTMPHLLWPLGPLVLYMLLRIWMLARRSQLHEDPVVFIMRDWRSQVVTAVGAALVLIAAVV